MGVIIIGIDAKIIVILSLLYIGDFTAMHLKNEINEIIIFLHLVKDHPFSSSLVIRSVLLVS